MTSSAARREPGSGADPTERLIAEISQLRAEVACLEARLADAQGLADRDALTPALNRRALIRELSRVIAARGRYGSPASLIYFDLDGLKAVNDRFGHAVGDAALRATAERLRREIRESDVIGRLGGDEFAVILGQVGAGVATAKAAALAEAVAREPLQFAAGATRLQLSWGVAEIRPAAEPEALIAEADAAMYARKRAGRP
jgi:diguanylate cyclase (GGDEF)-like protein